jgi:hypothetical protein
MMIATSIKVASSVPAPLSRGCVVLTAAAGHGGLTRKRGAGGPVTLDMFRFGSGRPGCAWNWPTVANY